MIKKLQVSYLEIYGDSQLVINQVTETYQAKRENMMSYLWKAKELLESFSSYVIEVLPKAENNHENALAKLTSTKDVDFLNIIFMEFLLDPTSMSNRLQCQLTRSLPKWIL